MDETSAGFFKLIFFFFIAPFWLAYHVLRLSWQYALKPLFTHLEQRSDDKRFAQQIGLQALQQKHRDEARAKQLAALGAAVPSMPPEKMRATIQLNEIKVPRMEQRRIHHAFGEDSWVSVEVGEFPKYAVDMILQMSETERAIINQHQLQYLTIEDNPIFSPDQLREIHSQHREELSVIKDAFLKEITEQSQSAVEGMLKEDRKQTLLGDYLVSPFSRIFETPHEAKLYADKLKTKILPQIKQHLDMYRNYQQSETIEL
jgi:hypothetical protein